MSYQDDIIVLASQHQSENTQDRRPSFPFVLHTLLGTVEAKGNSHIVSWQPNGRCFMVHRPKWFVQQILPLHFRMSKFASFQRQLNFYGFRRIKKGPDKCGYYHAFFVRERRDLCQNILRMKSRGGGYRASVPEPNFYLPEISTNGPRSMTETATVGRGSSFDTVTAPQDVDSAVHLAMNYPIMTMVPFMQSSHYADESAASLLNVGGLAHQPHPWHEMNYFSTEGLQRQWSVNRSSSFPAFSSGNTFVESVRQQQPQQTVAMISQPSFFQGIDYGAVIPDRSAVPVMGNSYSDTWASVFQAFMASGNLLQPYSNTNPSSLIMTPPFSSMATDGRREEPTLSEVRADDKIVCEHYQQQQPQPRCDPPEADQSFDAYLVALQFENWDGTLMASDEGDINGKPSSEAIFPAKAHQND